MGKKNTVSPWAVHLADQLAGSAASVVAEKQRSSRGFQILLTNDSLVAKVHAKDGAHLAFRMVYTPAADLVMESSEADEAGITCTLASSLGNYEVTVKIADDEAIDTLHYAVRFTPKADVTIPFWPKD